MISVKLEGVESLFPDVGRLKADLAKICQDELLVTRNRIVAATEAGSDANGARLRTYSPRYQKAIHEGRVFGYDGTKKTSTATDLKITGLLKRSMQVRPIQDGAECAFVGQHPVRARGEFDTRDRFHHQGVDSRGRKTGSGKFGLGGRLAERARKARGSVTNEQLAGWLYGLGFTGWFQFGKVDVDRIAKRLADAAVQILGRR